MEQINTWSGGMNKDLDPLMVSKDTYFDALNFRLNTERGSSAPSLSNIFGNSKRSQIQNTTGVHRLSIVGVGAVNFTIQGQTGSGITIVSGGTVEDIYNYIISDTAYSNCVQNTSFTTLSTNSYNIYYNNNYLYIVGSVVGITQNTITGTSTNNGIVLFTSNYIQAQSDLYIIGSSYIRDNIYILTTSNTTLNPGGHDPNLSTDPTSIGQVWELIYNQIADTCTINLVYNNYVDFTAVHPIPQNAITGRYENNLTQRLYFTDNFNSLRSMNVKDPQVFALDVSLLSIKPAVDFSPPILQKIVSGGNLAVGVFEAGYRLKNTGGAVTKISPLSNTVNIVTSSEDTATGGGNFSGYYGNVLGTLTSKAIIWKIQDIDTDFDRIEIIIIYRDILSNLPTSVTMVFDEPIPASGEFTFTYTGNETPVILTLEDLTLIDDTFTHCKTLSTKDNRLIIANVKSQREDLDYDARTYRFPISSTSFQITENNIVNSYTNATWNSINEKSDAINSNTVTQLYQQNSTVLGGNGPNISYNFGTIAVRADSTINLSTNYTDPPFRHTNPEYAISEFNLNVKRIDGVNVQVYPTNSINDDIKYPYVASLYKGYDRSETQRFGITFYDKQNNPFYTKWVGDILFPHYNETNINAFYEDGTTSPSTDFGASFVANKTGINEAFVNQLFIQFTVNIPDSISDLVGGYSICRVDRTQENRTVLGTGILNQVISDGGALFLPDVQQTDAGVGSAFPFGNINANNRALPLNASDFTPIFDCPEFLLGGFPGFKTGDKIRIISRQAISNTNQSITIDGNVEPYIMRKYYSTDATYPKTTEITITAAGTINRNDTFQFISWQFNNYTRTDGAPGSQGSDAIGSSTLGLELPSKIEFNITYGCTEANGKKLIAQYIRPIANQYGGNTYTQRSTSEYIVCSHFRPVKSYITSGGTIDTFKVFGGDVYTQIYDNQKQIKNWNAEGLGGYSGGDGGTPGSNYGKVSVTHFFPCVSTHNTDLRHGDHINRNLTDDNGTGASNNEAYDYNHVYSNIGNIRVLFPKPSQLTLITENDIRVWASELKTNGELIDSWGIFKDDNYWDVEGSYGPINALEILQDKMFFLQDNAFGVLSINPRSLMTDSNSVALQLGTGDVLQRHDYISTEYGSKHQWSVLKSPNSIIWWDSNSKRLVRFNGKLDSLSSTKGLSGYLDVNGDSYLLTHDNPIYNSDLIFGCGVHGVYDYINDEFIITFLNVDEANVDGIIFTAERKFTLCFNEDVDAFTSFYSFSPNIYITNHREVYSPNLQLGSDLYLHNRGNYCQFYGITYDSTITSIINPNPQYIKIFDNLEWITETFTTDDKTNITNNTFSSIRAYNSFQNTDFQNLIVDTNLTRKERTWKTFIPRNRVMYTNSNTSNIFNDVSPTEKIYGERIRDSYMYLDLKFNNNNNYRFISKLLKTIFRISNR